VNLILYAPPSAGKANLRSWIMAVAGRSAQVKALASYAALYQILYTGRLIWPMKPSMPVASELLTLRLAQRCMPAIATSENVAHLVRQPLDRALGRSTYSCSQTTIETWLVANGASVSRLR
jgi:hypothetical protein